MNSLAEATPLEIPEKQDQAPSVAERIKAARELSGMSIDDVCHHTRIARRHVEMIESGHFDQLPARTYAVGFSRTIARLLGLDGDEIAAEVRAELEARADSAPSRTGSVFEPGDPARIPSARLGWIAAIAAVALMIGLFIYFGRVLAPAAQLPPLVEEQPQAPVQKAPAKLPAAPPQGLQQVQGAEVAFTAREAGIWVKFYDSNGRQLMQKQMELGERYVVPADAKGPMIWTGRPDALEITIGGRAVPRLADTEQVVKDVPVTSEALLARNPQPSKPAT